MIYDYGSIFMLGAEMHAFVTAVVTRKGVTVVFSVSTLKYSVAMTGLPSKVFRHISLQWTVIWRVAH